MKSIDQIISECKSDKKILKSILIKILFAQVSSGLYEHFGIRISNLDDKFNEKFRHLSRRNSISKLSRHLGLRFPGFQLSVWGFLNLIFFFISPTIMFLIALNYYGSYQRLLTNGPLPFIYASPAIISVMIIMPILFSMEGLKGVETVDDLIQWIMVLNWDKLCENDFQFIRDNFNMIKEDL